MGAKILVADDDKNTRWLLKNILEAEGYSVALASDGLEAWQKIRSAPPELALLDWMMPGLNGIDLCRRIKADPSLRSIYVIVVTSKETDEDKILALEAGADDFLVKPINRAELKARIKVATRVVEFQKNLIELALTDALTGLANRRAFQSALLQETERARRYGTPLSLLVIDIDRFKEINDRFGHGKGDEVLGRVARRIAKVLRKSDAVFRIGGDEFAAVLLEPEANARLAIARLKRAFQGPSGLLPVDPAHPTLSVGLATFNPSESADDLFRRADAEMYRDKRGGSLRVPPPPPETGADETSGVLIIRGDPLSLERLAERLTKEGFRIAFGRDESAAQRGKKEA